MKRILFVDDESQILEGLQNLLRKNRRQWDMKFALGGEAALEELAKSPFDVVVSDMRMPRMDGAELLQRVKELYPSIARIVLSGQADASLSMRAVAVAHQFLNKPCDANQLQTVIERTCKLQALLQDEVLREVVGALDSIPSVPRTYLELRDAAANPKWSMAEVTATIEKDPAMTAKILQLVNSAYFGISQPVTSIQQAISYLGIELLKGLALNVHVFSQANNNALGSLTLDEMQAHAFLTAQLARRFGNNPKHCEEAFTVGILHDIGQIVLMLGMNARYEQVLHITHTTDRALQTVEQEFLSTTHAKVGAYLLGMWGLPFSIVETVAFHHDLQSITEGSRELLGIIHVAETFAKCMNHVPPVKIADAPLNKQFLSDAGLLERLPKWREIAEHN